MKKLAVFVEGQTEQIFFQKFLIEMAGTHNVALSLQNRTANRILELRGNIPEGGTEIFYALIYDCQCDGQVKSKILESRDRLIASGFSVIIGLLDLYPRPLADLVRFKTGLSKYVPTAGIPIKLHVAVAEVEAWFLQEFLHYSKIHADLTLTHVASVAGFNPQSESAEALPHPAQTLKEVYKSVGLGYDKSRRHVQRTVDALDIASMCLESEPHIPSFGSLRADIEEFLEL